MKTIETTLGQLNSESFVEDLRNVLREKDPDYFPVEKSFHNAAQDLTTRIG